MRIILPRCVVASVVLACGAYFSLEQRASAQTQVQPGQVIISEFRLHGPAGEADEFVELYNNTDAPIVVQSSDGTSGWTVASLGEGDNVVFDSITIPNGTVIPARGHFLATCSLSDPGFTGPYSLDGAAAGDMTYRIELGNGTGVALFATTDPDKLFTNTPLDAAGFADAETRYREGAPLSPKGGVRANVQHSFVRRWKPDGRPQDTNDNAADFILVAVDPSQIAEAPALLGAPGPENTSSPILRNGDIALNLLDPSVSSAGAPNRERRPTVVPNGNLGTLIVRRTVVNNLKFPVTRLRFRVTGVTSLGTENTCAASPCADVRVLTSQDGEAGVGGEVVQVRGLRLEEPPAQPLGGGWNSSVSADFITLSTPLQPGESVNVQFVLGVMRSGSFRFFVNVEALTGPAARIVPRRVSLRR